MRLIFYLFTAAFFFEQPVNTLSGFVNEEFLTGHPTKNADTLVRDFVFGAKPPFKETHASTLIHLKDGSFLVAAFAGTKEGNDDVGIWMVKGKPGNWGVPFRIAKIKDDAHWNPVLFQSPEGKIFLFFKVGKRIATWNTWVITSVDEGRTWSEPYELVPGDFGGRGPVRNKPIVLSNGVWIAGASNENGPWNVFFDRSEDGGKTWTATLYVDIDRISLGAGEKKIDTSGILSEGLRDTIAQYRKGGVIQPTLWESEPGHVHALLRSTYGVVCRTDSKDYGKTWSPVYSISFPNPNSGIDLTKLVDGTLVMASNQDNANWGSRGVLSLFVSKDNGFTWTKVYELERGKKEDEYSYPAIISFSNRIALTYTWNRKNIVFREGLGEVLFHRTSTQ